MAYNISHADGTLPPISVNPLQTTGSTYDIEFVGRGVPNHGQIHQTNFLKILEHFSSPIAPAHPVKGQQWFDSTLSVIKIFDGTDWILSQSCACTVSATPPTFIAKGQMWYNTTTSMLMVQTGTSAGTSKWVTAIDESLLYLALLM